MVLVERFFNLNLPLTSVTVPATGLPLGKNGYANQYLTLFVHYSSSCDDIHTGHSGQKASLKVGNLTTM